MTLTRSEFHEKARVRRYAFALKVDPKAVVAFEKSAQARRGTGQRKAHS